jgi:hypothetical protein
MDDDVGDLAGILVYISRPPGYRAGLEGSKQELLDVPLAEQEFQVKA